MTTTDFPDMAVDGYIYGNNANYATARSTATAINTGAANVSIGQNAGYLCLRGFLKFDTTSLPAGAVISQVNIGLVCIADYTSIDFDLYVTKCNWSAHDPLTSGNMEAAYDACLAATLDALWRNSSGMSLNTQYFSGNLDIAWPVKGGYTYYGLISKEDYDNSAPAGSEYLQVASQDNATPAYRPILRIEYTLGGKRRMACFFD